MKILLDTHTFLWYIWGRDELGAENRALIENPSNVKLLSIASLWEIAVKVNIGKLRITVPITTLVPSEIQILSINLNHLEVYTQLPLFHRDPFDRLIIAQAMSEDLPVLSVDNKFDRYAIAKIWR
ncbi:MAG: type II toxin-antitoxin system VapC family toxin [Chitinophagales bacterium]